MNQDWQYVLNISDDNHLTVLDLASGDELAQKSLPEGLINEIVFSPNGCCIAYKIKDRSLEAWRWKDDKVFTLINTPSEIRSMNFDNPGTMLVIVNKSNPGLIEVWDVENGNKLAHMTHETDVQYAAFDPTGKYLVTASTDKTARVWNIAKGQPLAEIKHDAEVVMAKFSPDGKYVLSAGSRSDHTARLWLWRPEDLIAETCARLTRNLTEDEWQQYIGIGKPGPTCSAKW